MISRQGTEPVVGCDVTISGDSNETHSGAACGILVTAYGKGEAHAKDIDPHRAGDSGSIINMSASLSLG